MEPNNWDLEAVVRGCSSASSAADLFSSFSYDKNRDVSKEEDELHVSYPELSTVGNYAVYDLEELYKPFMAKPSRPIQISDHYLPLQQQHYQQRQLTTHPPQPSRQAQRSLTHSRPKKKRNQQKKVVCQVPADGTASDLWAWRKYGQKPIKGSPYPRGYYRCSSSKGCPARKQVERSRANSGTLLITYTAEHNHPVPTHRSSLAGSTRQKVPPPSPPATTSAPGDLSPRTTLTAGETAEEEDEEDDGEEDEDLLTVEDMEIVGEDDVLFMEECGSTAAPLPERGDVDFRR